MAVGQFLTIILETISDLIFFTWPAGRWATFALLTVLVGSVTLLGWGLWRLLSH